MPLKINQERKAASAADLSHILKPHLRGITLKKRTIEIDSASGIPEANLLVTLQQTTTEDAVDEKNNPPPGVLA
jgi:hypothetical protein